MCIIRASTLHSVHICSVLRLNFDKIKLEKHIREDNLTERLPMAYGLNYGNVPTLTGFSEKRNAT